MTLQAKQEWMHAAIVGPPAGDERLRIYQRAYRTRLVETLHAMFPALLFALGESLFDEFALDFILRDPPRGWTLERLADTFPGYLTDTRPDEPWAQFIVELASLEGAWRRLSDGDPTPRVLECTFPVDEFLLAVKRGEQPERPAPEPCTLIVARRGFRVAVRRGTPTGSRRR